MARPMPIEVHPQGLGLCTCCQPWEYGGAPRRSELAERGLIASHGLGWFVCGEPTQKGAEDGLCDSCRTSPECMSWRTRMAAELEQVRSA